MEAERSPLKWWTLITYEPSVPLALGSATNFESLTIPVRELRSILCLVKRSANTLISLRLLGKLSTEDEVREMIQVFNEVNGGKLKQLISV